MRYIHFATHAVLDERFPLNSALVLTIPTKMVEGQDNGLFQAWEIFDQVRIRRRPGHIVGMQHGAGTGTGRRGADRLDAAEMPFSMPEPVRFWLHSGVWTTSGG